MQNSTTNHTHQECGLCVHSSIIPFAALPYILIFLPANGCVLWLMISSPGFCTDKMDVSEFHLVLTELLFGFMGPPLLTRTFFVDTKHADEVFKFINVIFVARIQFQSTVCLERYLAVVHPVLYLRFKPLRYRMSLCCLIWLETVINVVVQMLFCSEDPQAVGMYTAAFSLVFLANSFCCLSVLRALKQPPPGEGERGVSNLIKKRAFNMVLVFQVSTFFSFVPLITLYLLMRKMDYQTFCILQPPAYCGMIWLGAIYPVLYLRRAGKRLVRNHLCPRCFQE